MHECVTTKSGGKKKKVCEDSESEKCREEGRVRSGVQ